jgi:hypothetical protein
MLQYFEQIYNNIIQRSKSPVEVLNQAIQERMKFHLIYMIEISAAKAWWILESKFASYGGS